MVCVVQPTVTHKEHLAGHSCDSLLANGYPTQLGHVQGLPARPGHERPCSEGASKEVQQECWAGVLESCPELQPGDPS